MVIVLVNFHPVFWLY